MVTDLQVVRFRAQERPDLMAQAWRVRHQVFCEDLGWQIPSLNGIEMDGFDLEATHCAAIQRGLVLGCWRALSTAGPYLLEQCFADLLPPPLPKSPRIWEISRFAVLPSASARRAIGEVLVREGIAFGRDQGARRFIAVTDLSFERFLKSCGLTIKRLSAGPVPGVASTSPVGVGVIQCEIDARNLASIGLLPAVA